MHLYNAPNSRNPVVKMEKQFDLCVGGDLFVTFMCALKSESVVRRALSEKIFSRTANGVIRQDFWPHEFNIATTNGTTNHIDHLCKIMHAAVPIEIKSSNVPNLCTMTLQNRGSQQREHRNRDLDA